MDGGVPEFHICLPGSPVKVLPSHPSESINKRGTHTYDDGNPHLLLSHYCVRIMREVQRETSDCNFLRTTAFIRMSHARIRTLCTNSYVMHEFVDHLYMNIYI